MSRMKRLLPLLLVILILSACGAPETEKQAAGNCTFSISCATILDNRDQLKASKADYVPDDGVILPVTEATFYEGETVFDVLQRLCRENDIPMESSWSPMYKSAYIEGIAQLYEFDCGELSGWMAVTVVSSTRFTRRVTVEPMASFPCSTVQTTLMPGSVVPVVCLALKSYV